jgi:diaminopimelate epimerase
MTRFAKAHACGNDFLIVESEPDRELAISLCARHTGIGADGVEFVRMRGPREAEIRLMNADGSIAEISGNGTRCVAAWIAHRQDAKPGETIRLNTDAGARDCVLVSAADHHFEFSVGMGTPTVHDRRVRLIDGSSVEGFAVSTGNPHFVVFTEDELFQAHGRAWERLGQELCFHLDFPEQTNVEFVRVIDTNTIEVRFYERGAGPTRSSGTGTCASAAATIARRGGGAEIFVRAPGGAQRVDWDGAAGGMTLTGPAELIAEGDAC